jgi:hypothetical protein
MDTKTKKDQFILFHNLDVALPASDAGGAAAPKAQLINQD